MPKTFFEQTNSATVDNPFIDAERQNLSFVSHYHKEIELIPVISGEVTVFCSFGTVKARQGDIAILMPGEIHSFSPELDNTVHVIKLYCKNAADGTDLSKYRFDGGLIEWESQLCRKIWEHIDNMVEERSSNKPGAAYAVNANANMILAHILRSENCKKQDSDTHRKNAATLYLLNRVTEYIETHLAEQIPLEHIATHCNMSKYYFAHTFKGITGVTFFDYLTSYRMDIALRLLAETDISITEISHRSGFSNTRMFNRLFRARLGVSPSEYRKKHQL